MSYKILIIIMILTNALHICFYIGIFLKMRTKKLTLTDVVSSAAESVTTVAKALGLSKLSDVPDAIEELRQIFKTTKVKESQTQDNSL